MPGENCAPHTKCKLNHLEHRSQRERFPYRLRKSPDLIPQNGHPRNSAFTSASTLPSSAATIPTDPSTDPRPTTILPYSQLHLDLSLSPSASPIYQTNPRPADQCPCPKIQK